MRTTFLQALLVFGLALLSGTLSREAQAQGTVSFNRDIRPILSNTCFGCHGPDDKARKADLRLDTEDGLFGDRGDHAVVVRGKPEQSEMIARITASEPAKRMPPRKSGKKLTPQEIDLIARWIKQGAPFARHWAYSKPIRPALPKVKDSNWPKILSTASSFPGWSAKAYGRLPKLIATPSFDDFLLISPACRPRSRRWTRSSTTAIPRPMRSS